jgi:CO/xanthine dehydrogenase Mo-binding subunit
MTMPANDTKVASGDEFVVDVFGATLTRSKFVKGAGALVVSLGFVGSAVGAKTASASVGEVPLLPGMVHSPDPSQVGAWFTINADNTIILRTGRGEMGQGTASTAYAQIAADELYVPYSTITDVIMADTDRTPDGGLSAGMLSLGGTNIRKAAAYTYQALLAVASAQFGVPVSALTAQNGVISGGGKQATYGQLVTSQQFNLTIPVTADPISFIGLSVAGTPPTKPPSQYQVVGKSIGMRTIPPIVSATATYVGDVRLPGMLHARPVHPPTLGSALISVGKLDPKEFPNAKVVVKGNFVAVVDPHEYTAIEAASRVAAGTKWTNWSGLPGSGNTFAFMRTMDWTTTKPSFGRNVGDPDNALQTGAIKLANTYQFPTAKHAGIGPTCAVADCRSDGTVWVYAHGQNVSEGRGQWATMLGIPTDKVVVRWFDGSGHYGRSNGGNTGAEEEAIILSKELGVPIRMQWMRGDDMAWSTQHAPVQSDLRASLDASGKIIAFDAKFYEPGMQDDRPVGALLAGLPTQAAPTPTGVGSNMNTSVSVSDTWLYDVVPNARQMSYGTYQLGTTTEKDPTFNSQIGLRPHSMRTPQQRQQNFAQESMMSELAAAAKIDPIQFRLNHTTNPRLVGVLTALRDESGWDTRPSPNPNPTKSGSALLYGQGCSAMNRGALWACAVHVAVNPKTGKVQVLDVTTVADVGIVVNPLQLQRMAEGGAVMGTSEALHEQVVFNKSAITSRDWATFPILRIRDVPKIKVVILPNPSGALTPGGGGEGPNGFIAAAIANAVFDATGKQPRRLPMVPKYIKSLLAS